MRAVGVDTIIAESGVAKATFYKHFPAKDDLVVAYLDRVDEVWTGQLHAAAEAAGPAPADQLVGLFDALDAACRRDGYRGCGFINAAAGPRRARRARPDRGAQAQVRAWLRGLRGAGGAEPRAAGAVAVAAAGRRAGQRGTRRGARGRRGRAGHRRGPRAAGAALLSVWRALRG